MEFHKLMPSTALAPFTGLCMFSPAVNDSVGKPYGIFRGIFSVSHFADSPEVPYVVYT